MGRRPSQPGTNSSIRRRDRYKPSRYPDGLLSKLVRYGLDQCIGFSCREAGYAELNHLLIRFIFLDQHLALGLVRDGALDMSIDGVIAPLMYFMLAIGVDIIPEQWNKADSPRDC